MRMQVTVVALMVAGMVLCLGGVAEAATITLNATETVTVARAGTVDPGGTAGTIVVRERVADGATGSDGRRHIAAFSNYDLSGVTSFNPGAGDQAFFDLNFQGRLNGSYNSALYVAQVTSGAWTTASPPLYQSATKSPSPAGPGSQTREHVVVTNIKPNPVGLHSTEVTDIVNAWINGPDANNGLAVYIGDTNQGAGFGAPTLRITGQAPPPPPPPPAATVALYDFNGPNGNFNTTAFDSRDVDLNTTASRLSQGGGLTGGGANTFVLTNALFNPGDSGSPGLNVAGVNQSTATKFFSFTTAPEPGTTSVTYEDLSFFGDGWRSSKVSVRMVDGGGAEQILAASISLPGSNAPVVLRNVDFPDFTSSNVVEWRFYPFGTTSANFGVRFDDITLRGTANLPGGVIPEPATMCALGLAVAGLGGYVRKRKTRS